MIHQNFLKLYSAPFFICRCQGMTIGANEANRYIVISPGTRAFEARNPGALYVALSRARSAGCAASGHYPDFAWGPNVLVNEDRLCYCPSNRTIKARNAEIARLSRLSQQTKNDKKHLAEIFDEIVKQVDRNEE